MNTYLQHEVAKLGKQEKLELLSQIWDSLDEADLPPVSDALFDELGVAPDGPNATLDKASRSRHLRTNSASSCEL